MPNQHLFEAIQNMCGYIPLQGEMGDLIQAIERDTKEDLALTETINLFDDLNDGQRIIVMDGYCKGCGKKQEDGSCGCTSPP